MGSDIVTLPVTPKALIADVETLDVKDVMVMMSSRTRFRISNNLTRICGTLDPIKQPFQC